MRRVDLSPCLNHWDDFSWSEVGKGLVVFGGESQDVAFASHGLSAE